MLLILVRETEKSSITWVTSDFFYLKHSKLLAFEAYHKEFLESKLEKTVEKYTTSWLDRRTKLKLHMGRKTPSLEDSTTYQKS